MSANNLHRGWLEIKESCLLIQNRYFLLWAQIKAWSSLPSGLKIRFLPPGSKSNYPDVWFKIKRFCLWAQNQEFLHLGSSTCPNSLFLLVVSKIVIFCFGPRCPDFLTSRSKYYGFAFGFEITISRCLLKIEILCFLAQSPDFSPFGSNYGFGPLGSKSWFPSLWLKIRIFCCGAQNTNFLPLGSKYGVLPLGSKSLFPAFWLQVNSFAFGLEVQISCLWAQNTLFWKKNAKSWSLAFCTF